MTFLRPTVKNAPDLRDFDYLPQANIYLDSACQTLRPQQVIDAMDAYYHEYNACGDRVKYEWGRKVDRAIAEARSKLLKLAGKSSKDYVCAFTLNTTYGLNLILSQLPRGVYQQMITSEVEHNSVFLPSITYARKLELKRTVLERSPDGALIYKAENLDKAVVVVNTTTNFDGSLLTNAEQLTNDAHRQGGIVIFDAAQSMAFNPEAVAAADFDAICFSGHKLYGPSLGVIIIKKELLESLDIGFIGGGAVEDVDLNSYTPLRGEPAARLEPGLQNFAGIIGLSAAVDWLEGYRPLGKTPKQYEQDMATKLYEALETMPGITLVNQTATPVLSFYADKLDSHKLAAYLSAQDIMARSGYFCCHYYLDKVRRLPPMLRLSPGLNVTEDQLDTTIKALQIIIGGR